MASDDDEVVTAKLLAIMEGGRIVRWIIVGGIAIGALYALQPLVRLIAGRETILSVSIEFAISFAYSVLITGAAGSLWRWNKRLRSRIRDLEHGRRPKKKQSATKKRRS